MCACYVIFFKFGIWKTNASSFSLLHGGVNDDDEIDYDNDNDEIDSEVTACEVFEMKALKQKKK